MHTMEKDSVIRNKCQQFRWDDFNNNIEFHKKPATVARYARYRLSSFVSFRAEAACVLVRSLQNCL